MKKGVLRNFTKFTGKHLCQRDSGRLLVLMPVILKLEIELVKCSDFQNKAHFYLFYKQLRLDSSSQSCL